jgi:PAS domain S-box-containing protein
MSSNSSSSVLTDCEFLVRAIRGIVWEADPKTIKFTFVSAQAKRILGYAEEEWLADNFWVDHLHPDDRQSTIDACARATAKGLDHEFEYRMIHSDGSEVWLRDSVFVDMEGGEPVRLRGVMIDISEERTLEIAVRDSEELLRLIVSSAKDTIFRRRIYPVGKFEYISPAIEDMTGYTADEFYADPELASKITHREGQALDSKTEFLAPSAEAATIRIVRKNGTMAWVEMRSITILDDSGRQVAIEGIARDVTEREEALSRPHPSRELEAVGRLVSSVTHDFNNLLTIVLGYAGLALDSVKPGDHIRHDLEEILKAAQSACLLTRQLLASSRRQILVPTSVDLNYSVRELMEMLHRLVGERIELNVLMEPELGEVRVDPGQICQVILNLVVNARDAMAGGGILTIQTSSFVSPYPLTLAHMTLAAGKYSVISISDTGSGIDPAIQSRIFEPFFTTKPNGTGLGLSTVFDIIQQNKGGVIFKTESGKGTTFHVYLPMSEEPAAARDYRLAATDGHADETILIVEDDDTVLKVISEVLLAAGYPILTARMGDEALRLLHASPAPKLALIDMVLADTDGRDFGEQLARLRPEAIVVYMSGYIEKDMLGIENLDQLHFIQKPFTGAKLLETVRGLLDGNSQK